MDAVMVEFIIFYGFFFLLLVAIPVLVGAFIFVELKWTPMSSRKIRKAKNKRRPLLDLEYDDGGTQYEVVKEVSNEGHVYTYSGKTYFVPRPFQEDETTKPLWDAVKQLFSRRSFLRDCGVPIIRAYAGKLAGVTNLKCVAAMQYAHITGSEAQKVMLSVPQDAQQVVGGKEIICEVIWPVDLLTLKTAVPQTWMQAQWRAAEHRSEEIGFSRGRSLLGKWEKLFPLIIVGGVVAMILAVGIILVIVSG